MFGLLNFQKTGIAICGLPCSNSFTEVSATTKTEPHWGPGTWYVPQRALRVCIQKVVKSCTLKVSRACLAMSPKSTHLEENSLLRRPSRAAMYELNPVSLQGHGHVELSQQKYKIRRWPWHSDCCYWTGQPSSFYWFVYKKQYNSVICVVCL